jgi:di/tricarboxylate transporter
LTAVSLEAWITLAVLVVMIVALARELVPPAAAVLAGAVGLMLLGVTTPAQAFAGFANEAPITVAALFVLARAVDIAGVLQPLVAAIFGQLRNSRALLGRLAFPVAFSSAILNNTTIVAMTAPPVIDYARRRGLPPSRFLIPLSYAAVLGGVITTIGTSTNLTVSGLLSRAGLDSLDLFEITPVGLPVALAGVAVIVLLAPRLLPDRREDRPQVGEGGRDFTVTMRVADAGPLDGVSVERGGLRHLHGVYLVEIERQEHVVAPVTPTEVLRGGDLLTFVGRVDDIVDLQRLRGLVSAESTQLDKLQGSSHNFYEVVVGGSDLTGRTLRELGFRGRYGAAVLAIHRQGQRLAAKLGEVPLRLGDTLLVLADPAFRDRWRDSADFLLIAPLSGLPPAHPRKALIVGVIVAVFVVVTGLGLLPILYGALLTALAMVATGVLSISQARRAIDLNVIVLIAASFGLGAAVEQSGLGVVVADLLLAVFLPLGVLGALAGVLLATIALTELVSNNAAAVLLFPVALATATTLGLDPLPFVMVVLFGASLSFLTPVGYQTNLMVYGLGNYRFLDFPRLGLPVIAVAGTIVLWLVPIFFPFQPN